MLLDRDRSAAWLDAWQRELEQHPEFPRDQLALSLALHKHPYLKTCPLPAFGVSYGADLLQRLRGAHATTLTHWTSAKDVGTSGQEGSASSWAHAMVNALFPAAVREEEGSNLEGSGPKACGPEAVLESAGDLRLEHLSPGLV